MICDRCMNSTPDGSRSKCKTCIHNDYRIAVPYVENNYDENYTEKEEL